MRNPWRNSSRIGALTIAAVVGAFAGCGGSPRAKAPPPASPGTSASQAGLELSWWIVDDAPPTPDAPPLRSVLDSLSVRPVPVSWQTAETWRANGLKLYAAPVAELENLRARTHLVGPLHSTWILEAPSWREVARGPEIRAPLSLMLDGSPAVLQDGHLRMMLRCWTAPSEVLFGEPAAGVLGVFRLECVPQHVPGRRESPAFILPGDEASRHEPFTFASLALEATLLGDEALLIVPESPGESASGVVGPLPPRAVTLGEALLAAERPQGTPRTRTIVVIAPTPPGEFRLLDRAR